MNKKKTMTALLFVLAVLFIGIGYAAISNVQLNITGDARVEPGENAFDVNFVFAEDGTNTVTGTASSGFTIDSTKTYGEYTASRTAVLHAPEFTKKGEYVDFTFVVRNDSSNLSATITSSNINLPTDSTGYFVLSLPEWTDLTLAPETTGNIKVRVTCNKTPTEAKTWNNFVINISPQAAETTNE